MQDLLKAKFHDELRQGEAYLSLTHDVDAYKKRF